MNCTDSGDDGGHRCASFPQRLMASGFREKSDKNDGSVLSSAVTAIENPRIVCVEVTREMHEAPEALRSQGLRKKPCSSLPFPSFKY